MRRTQGEWVRIVASYQTSGLSVRRFSADEGVSEQSLRNWTRKLVGPRSIQAQKDTEFVEIVASPLSRSLMGKASPLQLGTDSSSGLRAACASKYGPRSIVLCSSGS